MPEKESHAQTNINKITPTQQSSQEKTAPSPAKQPKQSVSSTLYTHGQTHSVEGSGDNEPGVATLTALFIQGMQTNKQSMQPLNK